MHKSELFKTVILDGALPRKTFSMGHSYDKRYYLEARKKLNKYIKKRSHINYYMVSFLLLIAISFF